MLSHGVASSLLLAFVTVYFDAHPNDDLHNFMFFALEIIISVSQELLDKIRRVAWISDAGLRGCTLITFNLSYCFDAHPHDDFYNFMSDGLEIITSGCQGLSGKIWRGLRISDFESWGCSLSTSNLFSYDVPKEHGAYGKWCNNLKPNIFTNIKGIHAASSLSKIHNCS